MQKLLRQLTDEIYRINEFLGKKALSDKEIAEEEENLKDLLETQEKLKDVLEKIKKCPLNDENLFCDQIIELHVLKSNMEWYFQNLNENVQKIIENYPFSKEFLEKNL